jgi:hypothetical protein
MGTKVSDFRSISLCHKHHVSGRDSIHALGSAEKFESVHGIDVKEAQIQLLIRFLAEELGQEDVE